MAELLNEIEYADDNELNKTKDEWHTSLATRWRQLTQERSCTQRIDAGAHAHPRRTQDAGPKTSTPAQARDPHQGMGDDFKFK